jgi:histidine triad (HIT) family protein
MKPDCLFCKIAAGAVTALVVGETADALAFLDHRPVFPGHTLVIPRAHVDTLVDLPVDATGPLFGFVQRVARAVETGLSADGTFVAMNNRVSQSVPHVHIHIVPRHKKDGLKGFFWPRQTTSDAVAEQTRRHPPGAVLEHRVIEQYARHVRRSAIRCLDTTSDCPALTTRPTTLETLPAPKIGNANGARHRSPSKRTHAGCVAGCHSGSALTAQRINPAWRRTNVERVAPVSPGSGGRRLHLHLRHGRIPTGLLHNGWVASDSPGKTEDLENAEGVGRTFEAVNQRRMRQLDFDMAGRPPAIFGFTKLRRLLPRARRLASTDRRTRPKSHGRLDAVTAVVSANGRSPFGVLIKRRGIDFVGRRHDRRRRRRFERSRAG